MGNMENGAALPPAAPKPSRRARTALTNWPAAGWND